MFERFSRLAIANKRWKKADGLGWYLLGCAIRASRSGNYKRADFCLRNSNRLYRITRGSGHAFRGNNGF